MNTTTITINVLTYLGVKEPKRAANLIESVQGVVRGDKVKLTANQLLEVHTILSNFSP